MSMKIKKQMFNKFAFDILRFAVLFFFLWPNVWDIHVQRAEMFTVLTLSLGWDVELFSWLFPLFVFARLVWLTPVWNIHNSNFSVNTVFVRIPKQISVVSVYDLILINIWYLILKKKHQIQKQKDPVWLAGLNHRSLELSLIHDTDYIHNAYTIGLGKNKKTNTYNNKCSYTYYYILLFKYITYSNQPAKMYWSLK